MNIRELNPILYSIVPQLSAIQSLRRQLGFLRLYLFSCSDNVSVQLQKMVWPREYLYEHVHLYSTLDLLSVPSGECIPSIERGRSIAHRFRSINTGKMFNSYPSHRNAAEATRKSLSICE